MLRKARIILSVVIFGLITFYFLDFAEILPNSFTDWRIYSLYRHDVTQFYHPGSADTDYLVIGTYLLLYNLSDGYLSGYSDLDF